MTRPLVQALLPALLATAIGASPAQAPVPAPSQAAPEQPHPAPRPIALQPLALHARQIETGLAYLGQPLPSADHAAINEAVALDDEAEAVKRIEAVLDRHVLFEVEVNPESRVKVAQGAARPELVEQGSRLFLVKVANQAGVTATLAVESPNTGRVYVPATGAPDPEPKLTAADNRDKWAELSIYDKPPLLARLSGLVLEYRIIEIYSRDRGQRSARVSFNVGQGTQDIGFRNDVVVVFNALPARPVTLRVRDENGDPGMAAFVIRDAMGRLYSAPSKRLAPDLPFQSQIYRGDGETVLLPDGTYTVSWSAGPEYVEGKAPLVVSDKGRRELAVSLQRWIDPARYGWFSGDHHIHAAGCKHYQDPTRGVKPDDMMRQILGESLNVGSVLTWGPCYYHQKQFFTGLDDKLSRPGRLMHYDLEVSGFPSSHAGHLVLLGLKDQDYPGTARIEDWPSWDLPILRWARAQGAVVGFAHSGWGLQVKTSELPNDEMPGFDSIGANEYIVDVTHPDSVDFISAVDTPHVWELNIWYHTLNVGFRTRISGETDFPCIYGERVGLGRTYAKPEGGLTFPAYLDALRDGRSYVSDGRSHLIDLTVNGQGVGTSGGELRLPAAGTVSIAVQVAAMLDPAPDEKIRSAPYEQQPYWDVERARIGTTREVPVELIVNGRAVAQRTVVADGQLRPVTFDAPIRKSSWLAVRILPSAHSNPVFVTVGGAPIRASRRSARWCLAAVDQCWSQKRPQIRETERDAARQAYEHAREVYRRLLAESSDE
ncbi:MAG TPA: CehA/McbA family metallohydrolase [Vicinamibacteria bacterium]